MDGQNCRRRRRDNQATIVCADKLGRGYQRTRDGCRSQRNRATVLEVGSCCSAGGNHGLLAQARIVDATVHTALMEAGTSPLVKVDRCQVAEVEARSCHGAGERIGGECRRNVLWLGRSRTARGTR